MSPGARALPHGVLLLLTAATVGCGHTLPDEAPAARSADTGTDSRPGHAPELVGLELQFEETEGLLVLVGRARLGDIDDDLLPGGTLSGWLRDADGNERTSLDSLPLGSAPTVLPEPTLLEVHFPIARDPVEPWEVRLTLTDRSGNSSEPTKAVWIPDEDTGSLDAD